MNLISNQKGGVALLIVLSSMTILVTALISFNFNTRVNYRIAVYEKQKLQAYYLAKSGVNFSKILLKYYKETEKRLEALPAGTKIDVEPLYKLIPFSSELLRGLIAGQGEEKSEDSETPAPQETQASGADASEIADLNAGFSFLSREEAEKFLSFEGDFSLEITEEQNKFDINRFYGMETQAQQYDLRKKLLFSIFMHPSFEEAFENQKRDAEKLTHAIADWIDVNDLVNEFENVSRGNESGEYLKERYPVKNGKFLTLSELRLVSGMNDKLYEKLEPYATVYTRTGTERINMCLAEDELIKALIYHFTHFSNCTGPIEYKDEKMGELVAAAKSGCPKPDEVATKFNEALGLVSADESQGQPAPTGCVFRFQDLITKDNNMFRVVGTGTVGDTVVNLATVINIDSSSPSRWKTLYYRIQ